MSHIEFQVEEPSMEAMLDGLLPRLIGSRATWKIINYRSKHRLLMNLPSRLKGYRDRIEAGHLKIVVLVDQDIEDCRTLKGRLESFARGVGLPTKTTPAPSGVFAVVNRVVIQELEAWYLGDLAALRRVYPRVPSTLSAKPAFRNPDNVPNTWESLLRHLRKAGYNRSRFSKIDMARRMGREMTPTHNRSRSFNMFRRGVDAVLS